MFWIILLVIWLALPLGLIPAVVILSVKNSKLKKLLPESYEQSERKVLKKEKKPLGFTFLLIIGVLFIIVSGFIFSTTNWEYMSGIARTVLLISMSLVFFAACLLSEKKLKLEKTGFAFFILGGVFLPVSVVGIAYFELMGKWFSFDGDGSYMIALAMLAVTIPVLFVSELKYKGSFLTRYIFGIFTACEYVVFAMELSDLVYKGDYHRVLLPAIIITCGYFACIMVKSLKTVPVQMLLIYALVTLSFETGKSALAAALCALVCTVVSVTANKGIFSIASIFAVPYMTVNLMNIIFAEPREYHDDFLFAACSVGVLACTAFIFDLPSLKDSIKIKWLDRTFALSVLAMTYFMLDAADHLTDNYWYVSAMGVIMYFAVKGFIFRISDKDTEYRFSLSFVFLLIMIMLQKFDVISVVEAEYRVAVSFIATVPLVFIWKKYRKAAEIIVFIHTAAAIAVLMENAMCEEDINAVILAGACTLLAVFSYIKRAKKWFVLSALSLVVIVLYLTSEIWTSVSWWVYLLLIGLIFIFYAASNEYCRKTGQDNQIRENIVKFIERVWR